MINCNNYKISKIRRLYNGCGGEQRNNSRCKDKYSIKTGQNLDKCKQNEIVEINIQENKRQNEVFKNKFKVKSKEYWDSYDMIYTGR